MPPMPPHHSETTVPPPRFGPPTTANRLWRVVVVSGAAFCVCCLLWITAGFADPLAPGNQWLNHHGLKLVAATGIATVGSAVFAMLIDARQTRGMAAKSPMPTAEVVPEGLVIDQTNTDRRHDPQEPQA